MSHKFLIIFDIQIYPDPVPPLLVEKDSTEFQNCPLFCLVRLHKLPLVALRLKTTHRFAFLGCLHFDLQCSFCAGVFVSRWTSLCRAADLIEPNCVFS